VLVRLIRNPPGVSTALIGLIGVVAGAMVTGGVQGAGAWFDRRLSARSSARLLYMQLRGAEYALVELAQRRSWEQMITDWTSFGVAWERHSEALARVLATEHFVTVSSAFTCLANIARGRTWDAEHPELREPGTDFSVPENVLKDYAATVRVARRAVLEAAFTRSEKRRGAHLVALSTEFPAEEAP
jgi:hypothetical protein